MHKKLMAASALVYFLAPFETASQETGVLDRVYERLASECPTDNFSQKNNQCSITLIAEIDGKYFEFFAAIPSVINLISYREPKAIELVFREEGCNYHSFHVAKTGSFDDSDIYSFDAFSQECKKGLRDKGVQDIPKIKRFYKKGLEKIAATLGLQPLEISEETD
ncbi:hypothetical protein COU59_02995 [Candidatus Pacearchaeota archaeon CG10_big_fil_rev_8_21_14_0_10_34_12]|nr:MAG: hypothetical protein COU59_02995 [Candidatus Pacearchaeota archaeon CG10_big_fil_rev_8_21_14_0_10_34_12]